MRLLVLGIVIKFFKDEKINKKRVERTKHIPQV